MKGKRLSLVILFVLVAVTAFPFAGSNTAQAAAKTRPSGMIVYDDYGKYYSVYYVPGSNYTTPHLRYIGQPEVLNYYLSLGQKAYYLSAEEKSQYTIYNHGLSLPCGEALRDKDGKIMFMEPLTGFDQTKSAFSYSENFAYHVPYFNDYGYGGHEQRIFQQSGYTQLASVVSPINTTYPSGVPNCAIVKQSGTADYYRVARRLDHSVPGHEGSPVSVQSKMKIGSAEVLNLWTNFNSYTYETDITSLPNVGYAALPPGKLVRTTLNPSVYFTDDEGLKVYIPSVWDFDRLGFSVNDVTYVSQSTLDAAPTRHFYEIY